MDGECCDEVPKQGQQPKKKRSYGRLAEAAKKMRTQTHEVGEDCRCIKLKCFDVISELERNQIIANFNSLPDKDSQNLYLAGLITSYLVRQRHNRNECDEAILHSYSFRYKVRISRNNTLIEQSVCYKAFLALHGVTGRRIQTIQKQLGEHSKVLPDGRGKHANRPHALSDDTKLKVHDFFKSLRGRKSHYSLKKSDKIYLADDLNVKKLHEMYKEKNPQNLLSYRSFLNIFQKYYNFAFGYPRSDSCSTCDEMKAKRNMLNADLNKATDTESVKRISGELKSLETQLEVHQRKAQTFYDRKKECRAFCAKTELHEAIAIDYQKNLPTPNISTNVVYYKRQLTVQLFNVHILSSGDAYFYCYDQTVAKKGSNEVTSLLHDYVFNILSPEVKHLHIFCDSCGGQNKNKTMIRYLHYSVHKTNRLLSVEVTFPERGHSYLECDRNMTLIPKKKAAEVPKDWYNAIRDARVKPSPFHVIECEQSMFKDWVTFFDTTGEYKKTLSIPTRPIKELRVDHNHRRTVTFRTSFNGTWESTVVVGNQKEPPQLAPGEFYYPRDAYDQLIAVPKPKWKDLQFSNPVLHQGYLHGPNEAEKEVQKVRIKIEEKAVENKDKPISIIANALLESSYGAK